MAKEYPLLYYATPAKAEELRSKITGATITKITNDFPHALLKTGKTRELRSRWS